MGILPGGTGNQLARMLGIPLDAGVAAATLVAGQIARIDLGRLCEGRHFAIACARRRDARIGVPVASIAATALVSQSGNLAPGGPVAC